MNLRYKYIEGIGYFAQVKHGFFSRWKTIGRYASGFGLYPENHIDNPLKSSDDANRQCKRYAQWVYSRTRNPSYTYL